MRVNMIAFIAATCLFASAEAASFDDKVQTLLIDHVTRYSESEYFSGASLPVALPGEAVHNYYAGRVSREVTSPAVSEKTLFQIGSITKSFTAAILLQLEKENRLQLQSSLQSYLPQYSKWGHVRLDSLLNMTSCLPNYTDTPLFNVAVVKTPDIVFTNESLLKYVYPQNTLNPPLRSGYFYSNTGYVLADMIVEKTTGHSFRQELENRLIKPCGLTNTFYPVPTLAPEQLARMAYGYQYNIYDNPELVGVDVTRTSMSWAGAAGALVSTTEDIVKWVRALFMGNLLDEGQKQKLLALHSTKTGKPILSVSQDDPGGFALGVASKYNTENPKENFWFYEGQTMGFRAIYMYVPSTNIIVAAAFNSSPDGANDHAHELLVGAYRLAASL